MTDATATLTAALKAEARRIGFDLIGCTPAAAAPGYPNLLDWLNRGYAGEMGYIERRQAAYAHPAGVLPAVKSVVMCGVNYRSSDPPPAAPNTGRVARYAVGGVDYHDLLRDRLRQLGNVLHARQPGCVTRGIVDTAPLLERDFARLAGLGWFGKNTLLINKHAGSWLLLAALLTDVVLNYDEPHTASHCGTCTRCLDACPTDAFVEPYILDARKCISYLTIELKGSMPEPLRAGVGDWLFGCDVCQEVCPWNHKAPRTPDPAFAAREDLHPVNAIALLGLSPQEFQQQFAGTPLDRPGRAGLLRNAAIVLGNTGDTAAVPALRLALDDVESTVREAAAWALERLANHSR